MVDLTAGRWPLAVASWARDPLIKCAFPLFPRPRLRTWLLGLICGSDPLWFSQSELSAAAHSASRAETASGVGGGKSVNRVNFNPTKFVIDWKSHWWNNFQKRYDERGARGSARQRVPRVASDTVFRLVVSLQRFLSRATLGLTFARFLENYCGWPTFSKMRLSVPAYPMFPVLAVTVLLAVLPGELRLDIVVLPSHFVALGTHSSLNDIWMSDWMCHWV